MFFERSKYPDFPMSYFFFPLVMQNLRDSNSKKMTILKCKNLDECPKKKKKSFMNKKFINNLFV